MSHRIDYSEYKTKVRSMRNKLSLMKRELDNGKRMNREIETLEHKLSKYKELQETLSIFIQATDIIFKRTINEDKNFKNRRLEYVSQFITKNIGRIFPDEDIKVKIESDYKYRSSKVKLYLVYSDGTRRQPHISAGKLLQELISFSAMIGIIESFGVKKFYLDEAFAASSPSNLKKIADLIRPIMEEGAQCIMIEQQSSGYKDLPRREIVLKKSPTKDCVEIVEVKDY